MKKILFIVFALLNFWLLNAQTKTITSDTTVTLSFGKKSYSVTVPKGSKILLHDGQILQIKFSKPAAIDGFLVSSWQLDTSNNVLIIQTLYPEQLSLNNKQVTFLPGIIEIYLNGNLANGTLATDLSLQLKNGDSLTLAAGSQINLYPDGNLKKGLLKYHTELHVGTKKTMFMANRPVSFYPNGNVKSGFLRFKEHFLDSLGKDHEIEAGSFVRFTSSGELKTK